MMYNKPELSDSKARGFAGAGILTAIVASLCCITPVLAFISGATGIASSFSWTEPVRPYLIGITVMVLGFAWYQKLIKSKLAIGMGKAGEIECACEENDKPNFWQSRKFLGIVTVFAALMLAFPHYAHFFYPSKDKKEIWIVNPSDIAKATFEVKGMTCKGCASHVENDVHKLAGILSVEASYENGSAQVEFDRSKVAIAQIEEAINATGYKVIGHE